MTRSHVLIVDDDPLIVDVLSTILDLEDLRVTARTDGAEALRAAAEEVPDVVVCDVMMPGTDGLQVCRTLKADPRTAHVPVILLTARDRAEDRRAGRDAGCDAYLTKPFSPLELIGCITDVVAGGAVTAGGVTPAAGA